MISTLILAFHLLVTPAKPACETVGPRVDGLYVTICDGTVTAVSNAKLETNQDPFTHTPSSEIESECDQY